MKKIAVLLCLLLIGCASQENEVEEPRPTVRIIEPAVQNDLKITVENTTARAAETDIPYGPHRLQKLDVFPVASPRATVIVVHGGGWESGKKEEFHPYAELLNAQRYLAVFPNYRLSRDGDMFPAQTEDVACAAAWFKQHATEYGADPGSLFLMGNSAGTQIAALLAYDEERDWLAECDVQTNLRFSGFIGFSGVYDFDLLPEERHDVLKPFLGERFGPEAWNPAEPINFVDAGDPPAYLLHGRRDDFVNPQNSVQFAARLEGEGIAVTLRQIPGAHSAANTAFLTDERAQREVFAFLDAHRGKD